MKPPISQRNTKNAKISESESDSSDSNFWAKRGIVEKQKPTPDAIMSELNPSEINKINEPDSMIADGSKLMIKIDDTNPTDGVSDYVLPTSSANELHISSSNNIFDKENKTVTKRKSQGLESPTKIERFILDA